MLDVLACVVGGFVESPLVAALRERGFVVPAVPARAAPDPSNPRRPRPTPLPFAPHAREPRVPDRALFRPLLAVEPSRLPATVHVAPPILLAPLLPAPLAALDAARRHALNVAAAAMFAVALRERPWAWWDAPVAPTCVRLARMSAEDLLAHSRALVLRAGVAWADDAPSAVVQAARAGGVGIAVVRLPPGIVVVGTTLTDTVPLNPSACFL